MLKKTTSIILAFLILMSAFVIAPITASARTEGDFKYEVSKDNTAEITEYLGSDAEVVIPDILDEYTVTSIAQSAFFRSNSLTSVTIPGSVASIGGSAFMYCENLTSVTIGNGVTSIGGKAFYECKGLQSIDIPDSVKTIGSEAFNTCYNLSTVTIGNNVNHIGKDVFYGTQIYEDENNWGEDGLYIGKYLISAKVTESGEYKIKDGTVTVAESAFDKLQGSLTSVVIPDSVINFGDGSFTDGAFKDCKSLKSVTIGNGITCIGENAFRGCLRLSNVIIPESVTTIGDEAFYGCEGIKSIEIPDSVTSIGKEAFRYCDSLKSITIGNGVTSIGVDAFDATPFFENEENWDNDGVLYIDNCLIDVKASYSAPEEYIVKDGTRVIADSAFSGYNSLKTVYIPDSVAAIGKEAFFHVANIYDDSYNLQTIVIGKGIKSIGEYAFGYKPGDFIVSQGDVEHKKIYLFKLYGYKGTAAEDYAKENSLTLIEIKEKYEYKELDDGTIEIEKYNGSEENVEIPSEIDGYKVSGIGKSAFSGNTGIKSVSIPDGVTSIGDSAFYQCTGLKSIDISGSVTSLGNDAFAVCRSLKNVTIHDGVASIGYEAFYQCKGLESIIIPGSVTSIGGHAFMSCTSLKNVTIHDGVKTIGVSAFEGCTSLASISIPDSVTEIVDSAFKNTHIRSITIPKGITEISFSLFTDCKFLESVIIPDSVTKINGYAFKDCISLVSVTIPDSMTEIANEAFMGCKSLKSVTIPKSVSTIRKKAFGYTSDGNKITDFKIYGSSGTEAEAYAKENGFEFIDPDKPTEPTTVATEPTQPATKAPTIAEKQPNPIKVSVKAKTVKLKKLKKKAQNVKAITIKSAQGKVSFKITSAAGKIKKLVKINSKGVITINKWKKAKKGSYKIKVKITAKGNNSYKPITVTKTVKIKIK